MTEGQPAIVLDLRIEITVTPDLSDLPETLPDVRLSRDEDRPETRQWDPPYPSAC